MRKEDVGKTGGNAVSTADVLQGTPEVFVPAQVNRLDERVWQTWVLKGLAQDERSRAAHWRAVKWISISVLLLAASGLWAYPS
jgi:hypothetical protein